MQPVAELPENSEIQLTEQVATLFRALTLERTSGLADLFSVLRSDLRQIACRERLAFGASDTLSTTALINETYLKMRENILPAFETPTHFFGIASRAMRQVMVDAARVKLAEKRGSGLSTDPLEKHDHIANDWQLAEKTVELSEALDRLEENRPLLAKVVFLRYYAGLNNQEIADLLGIDARTVRRHWVKARGWLYKQFK